MSDVTTQNAPAVDRVTGPWNDVSLPVAERVEALLAQMTLEEKVSQLGSHWEMREDTEAQGEVAPMEDAMSAGKLPFAQEIVDGEGQLTRTYGTVAVSVADGAKDLRERQAAIISANRFGIPALAHEECLTGFTAYQATVYPTSLAWGATFDPELIEEMAAAIGRDMAAVGAQQGLSPVLDVVRDARWGRVEETIGEDPYVVGTLGTAYVKGLQSGGVIATLKHFAGYAASRAARNHAPVHIGRRELEDLILAPFEMAVREGRVGSVMNSYADIDGEAPAASPWLLTEVLRDRWGFTGTVVADYWSVAFLERMHRVAEDQAEAARLAVTAGLDVELPHTGGYRTLAQQVRDGHLEEAVIDRSVRRVLRQKVQLGMLDAGEGESWEPQIDEAVDLDSAANRALARRVAARSLVLLKNDGVLPAPAEALAGKRVAVIGASADEPRTMMGCYSFPNHVLAKYPAGTFPHQGIGVPMPSILTALRETYDGAEITYSPGAPIVEHDTSGIADAAEQAAAADLAVVTVGDLAGMFGAGTSGEGCDVEDLRLPGAQQELVEAVLEAGERSGTPVVLVVVSGRPYALGGLAERCAAVVQAFFPGEEGGPALASLLSGEIEPVGRLPIGVPVHPGGQPAGYLAAPLGQNSQGVSNLDPTPLYPFGHGLSYSRVEYRGLRLSAEEIAVDGTVEATVTVANTGDRPVDEVVQLYFGDPVAQVARPVRQLLGYARAVLQPGETREVSFQVHADRFSFTGVELRRIVEPGRIDFWAGPSVGDLPLEATVRLSGEIREITGARVLTTPASVS
ncbi:beta-glucosidase family protein [Nesterenkonia sp. HG001]|uniref:beta-glucosidase family protein n=1 Tax=Nesterenkonia sp. HG001 TaxID=2983207 RepID=UPI002AC5E3A1|nr:glycoside hydrolase family 3 N-terminal domain-containing protein [Nesterenkonia sp. HG001]MDZ5078236.1 glycoside hydrolase family 3 C-terminal domain-containing protein [Nesterenkonia sp. HG001]